MRPIKLKAWDKRNKRWLTEEEWYLHPTKGPCLYWNRLVVFPEDLELVQFTGLLDKNGKEIYEGDVLTCEHYKKTKEFNNFITFKDGMFCFFPDDRLHQQLKPLSKSLRLGKEAGNAFEVIGNIYENPQLLASNR